MPRQVEDLARGRFDVLVVGGGIHGLFAAYDAASRGLSVALVERADFGGGLSFNHQRTIHGGLRALEDGHVGKSRRQINERRTWARIAPHLLRPLPFLVGTYRWTKRSRWILKAGFGVYDVLGRGRNADVSPELHLPRARLESAAATRRLFPGIADTSLTGGAIWYDYQTRHPDRLTWTVALAAQQAGATLANYVSAVRPIRAGGRIVGCDVQDELTGRTHAIEASATLLAVGARLPIVMGAFGVEGAPALVRAMNVLLDRPARDIATAAPGPSGRMLTAVPWRGFVLVGTHQSTGAVTPDEAQPPAAAVEACLADVNATFPALKAELKDLRMLHYGLTPAVVRNGRADLLPEPELIDHARRGAAGLFSMVGVKYTTARAAAEHAVDVVSRSLGRSASRCQTSSRVLPHAGIADAEGRLIEVLRELRLDLDRDVIEHLTSWYGTEAPDVARFAASIDQGDRLDPRAPILAAEIAYAATHAQAHRLSDAVLRRTALGSAGHPGRAALERAADIMGKTLGWSAEQRAQELAATDAVYPATSRRTP
ncbi:MAG TPA: FAD-dependent oxidoreductase [Vicinamibacterales bacterium]|nr:FAD-dependent oxidoreductase [Vicinamibacterales bacterium]